MRRDTVNEIIVRGPDYVWVETGDGLIKTSLNFNTSNLGLPPGYPECAPFEYPNPAMLLAGLKFIHSGLTSRTIWGELPAGEPLGDVHIEGNLEDGSRLMALLTPVSANRGIIMNIRRFRLSRLEPEDFIRFGSLTLEAVDTLKLAMAAHASFLVAAGTGCGKTTLLEMMMRFIPEDTELVFTVEDTAELRSDHPLWGGFIVREKPADAPSTFQELQMVHGLKAALRARPDWIIAGEIRDSVDPQNSPADVFINAISSGHAGACTLHAGGAYEAMTRLENMLRNARPSSKDESIRGAIGEAVRMVVVLSRFQEETITATGAKIRRPKRMAESITEILGSNGHTYIMNPLFKAKASIQKIETEEGEITKQTMNLEQVGIPLFGLELKDRGYAEMPTWWEEAQMQFIKKINREEGRGAQALDLLNMASYY
jgi:pilus assembly protein CpaF